MARLPALEALFDTLGTVVHGYSGGVDSAVLAVIGARRLGTDRFLAVLGKSPSLPAAQRTQARAVARAFGVPLLEVDTEELTDPRYRANPTNRCYYCKAELWRRLERVRRARGFDTLMDGTNQDDLAEHRPGLRAAREFGIRSPLVELQWTKTLVREAARELGLPIWDAPASPCLASRIRYGLEVTPARLGQVERGEEFLRALGVAGDLRVRHRGDHATIEVLPSWFPLLLARWAEVEARFTELGFARVERDPRGYRRGSLLPVA